MSNDTPLEVKLISQGTTLPPEISRDLLGRIVDEVFDGAVEDTTVIEDIYRVIAFAQQAAPVAVPDEHLHTARELLTCCYSWEPDVRILGNVRAGDAASFISAVLLSAAPTPPAFERVSTLKDVPVRYSANAAEPTPPAQQSQWVTDQFLPGFRKRLQWYDDVDFVRMADMETIIAEATGDTAAPEQECPNCFEGKSDHHHTCRKCGGTGKSTPAAPEQAEQPTVNVLRELLEAVEPLVAHWSDLRKGDSLKSTAPAQPSGRPAP